MIELRNLIAEKLMQIEGLEIEPQPIEDDLLEKGKVYFAYSLSDNYIGNYVHVVNISGSVVTLITENDPLLLVDTFAESIKEKLETLNFHLSLNDVSFGKTVRVRISGYVNYEEHNKGFI